MSDSANSHTTPKTCPVCGRGDIPNNGLPKHLRWDCPAVKAHRAADADASEAI